MGKVWAALVKELRQLQRDRAGLLVLFVMPMALVLIMALVQDSVMKATGESSLDVLWVDRDGGPYAAAVAEQLAATGAVTLRRDLDGTALDEERARAAVARGDYQFCVILPEGLSEALRARARQQAHEAVGRSGAEAPLPVPAPRLYVDPTVQATFRAAVSNALQRVLLALELRERSAIFAEELPGRLQQAIAKAAGPFFALSGGEVPPIRVRFSAEAVVALQEETAAFGKSLLRPNAVQQNVPAWTLFGMFFIVVPLSGLVIRERQSGTVQRLLAMPVSPLTLLTGKLLAYLLVGLLQCFCMLAVGFWILPLLGTTALHLGGAWPALLAVAVCASLAATGYGLLLGSVAGSYEQASMFGAVSVVIAAAVGGVMMPLYVMPKFMQQASVLSPLNWGHDAFLELLVRGGGLGDVWPRLLALLLFAGASLLGAWFFLLRRPRPD